MRIPSLLLVIVGLAACPPPIPTETDPGTGTDFDTDTDTDTDTEAGTEADIGELVASDQVAQLTSVVVVDRVAYTGADRFVVVQRNAGGSPGTVLGHTLVTSGETLDVDVELSGPLPLGRTQLFAILFEDSNDNGVFDDGTDVAVGDDALMDGFQATVVAGTPEVRVILLDGSDDAILVSQVIPASAQTELVALDTDNPTFRLVRGLRYEIQNSSDVRLEFVAAGATPAQDTVALAQGPAVGLAEDQAGIDWEDSGGFLRFTATASFLLNVDAYRDGDDIAEARGTVAAQLNR